MAVRISEEVWKDQALLQRNRERRLRELTLELQTYEERYEIRSDRVHDALTAGHLRETSEVCDWVMAYQLYCDLRRG